MHYRGNRVYSENLPFEINQIKCWRLDENVVAIHIIFNQWINPRTVKPDTIIINGMPLPRNIRFGFNRKGDTVKLIVLQRQNSFKMKLMAIQSFNGKTIEESERLIQVETGPGKL